MDNIKMGVRYFVLLKDINPNAPESVANLALFFRKVATWDGGYFTVDFEPINSDIYIQFVKQAIERYADMPWLDKVYEAK